MATYLYSKECPEGRIFNTQEEVDEALKNGWVDAPGKLDELQAHGTVAETQRSVESDVSFFENDEYEKPRSKKGK